VRAAVYGVVREASIAALLTALMILLFLGSWRSTLIVCISIPLSILTSLTVLGLAGADDQRDDAGRSGSRRRNSGGRCDGGDRKRPSQHGIKGKTLVRAILDGAQEIAVPAFVSTLCICIVFVPVLMLSGAAKYLFTPLAMGVVFAMLTSYLLTRTVVPTLVHYMLQSEMDLYQEGEGADTPASRSAGVSGASIRLSIGNSRNSGKAITACSNGCWRTGPSPAGAFMAFALASVG
jgi:multidrug efflux pump subunit AcrB